MLPNVACRGEHCSPASLSPPQTPRVVEDADPYSRRGGFHIRPGTLPLPSSIILQYIFSPAAPGLRPSVPARYTPPAPVRRAGLRRRTGRRCFGAWAWAEATTLPSTARFSSGMRSEPRAFGCVRPWAYSLRASRFRSLRFGCPRYAWLIRLRTDTPIRHPIETGKFKQVCGISSS